MTPPDVAATFSSPDAPLADPAAAARLRLSLQAGPVSIIPRRLPPEVIAVLDAADPDTLPSLDVSGPRDRVRRVVAAAVTCRDPGIAGAVSWLRDDVLDLASLYATATGATVVRVRLQVVRDDMCRRFHVDEVAYRLVTTYRGPGTEWLPPRLLATAVPNQPLGPEAVHRLDRGTVAILRGARAAGPDRPGVLHRSPPVAGSGQVRLFLAVDEAEPTDRLAGRT